MLPFELLARAVERVGGRGADLSLPFRQFLSVLSLHVQIHMGLFCLSLRRLVDDLQVRMRSTKLDAGSRQ